MLWFSAPTNLNGRVFEKRVIFEKYNKAINLAFHGAFTPLQDPASSDRYVLSCADHLREIDREMRGWNWVRGLFLCQMMEAVKMISIETDDAFYLKRNDERLLIWR